MECPHSQTALSAYLDGEMSLAETPQFERHLETCASCRRSLAASSAIRETMSDGSLYVRAPAALVDRIAGSLPRDESAREATRRSIWRPAWVLLAAAACIAIALLSFHPHATSDDLLAQEVVSGHIRSMMENHLIDVVSTDKHTVKPWFDGKLDFAPPVIDLASQGFPLTGGRLDYIGDRPVAALIYRRQQHVINLYIWTSNGDQSPRVLARQGYNLVRWSRGDMTFWAVSDLELTQLQQFAQGIHNPS